MALVLLAGCRSADDSYMPMEVGRTWTYQARAEFSTSFEPVSVRRQLSVAGAKGFELAGEHGVSRLAWKDGVLYAERWADATLSPPMPILGPEEDHVVRSWSGTVTYAGKSESGTATIRQAPVKVDVGGKKYSVRQSQIKVDMPSKTLEVVTDFAPGIGIVRQEQRTNLKFNLSLELFGEK